MRNRNPKRSVKKEELVVVYADTPQSTFSFVKQRGLFTIIEINFGMGTYWQAYSTI